MIDRLAIRKEVQLRLWVVGRDPVKLEEKAAQCSVGVLRVRRYGVNFDPVAGRKDRSLA